MSTITGISTYDVRFPTSRMRRAAWRRIRSRSGGACSTSTSSASCGPPAQRCRTMGRLVTAEVVAAAVLYLASPSAGSVTGTALAVDGGMAGLRLPPRMATGT